MGFQSGGGSWYSLAVVVDAQRDEAWLGECPPLEYSPVEPVQLPPEGFYVLVDARGGEQVFAVWCNVLQSCSIEECPSKTYKFSASG